MLGLLCLMVLLAARDAWRDKTPRMFRLPERLWWTLRRSAGEKSRHQVEL